MELNTLWFILIAVLYIGFFVLEGFDFGVGILLPFLGKGDTERRTIINTIGPHWDGNEVWLLTAGGATFAAFPQWYATMFSGLYVPLFLLLVGLIVRGVAFEFRGKDDDPRWRRAWDVCIFLGSLIPALLLGVAFANLILGMPINSDMHYVGSWLGLLNPYGLLGGVAAVALFTMHGAIFIAMKTEAELHERTGTLAKRLWLPIILVMLALLIATYATTGILERLGVNPGLVPVTGIAAILASGYFLRRKMHGWAFLMTSVTIAFTIITLFMILYPNVMISSLNPAWSLTIENASSSPYTLRVMTIVALIFVPIVLVYQGWSYWVFRSRVTNDPEKLVY